MNVEINYPSLDDFIKSHIRYAQHWNKKRIDMKDAKWQTLDKPTFIDTWTFAAGSQFKVFETTNFGWIVFHPTTLTIDGNMPLRRIFKW